MEWRGAALLGAAKTQRTRPSRMGRHGRRIRETTSGESSKEAGERQEEARLGGGASGAKTRYESSAPQDGGDFTPDSTRRQLEDATARPAAGVGLRARQARLKFGARPGGDATRRDASFAGSRRRLSPLGIDGRVVANSIDAALMGRDGRACPPARRSLDTRALRHSPARSAPDPAALVARSHLRTQSAPSYTDTNSRTNV